MRAARREWIAFLILAGCSADASAPSARSGGDLTVYDTSRDAFARVAPTADDEHRSAFAVGNSFFTDGWAQAPGSAEGRDGLGPTFNAPSCAGCHLKDGRGAPPSSPNEAFVGLLLRLSVPGENAHGGPVEVPGYGEQFNHRAILGVVAEGEASASYEEVPGTYPDGTAYSLRRPAYTFSNLAFGAMPAEVMVSPRVAPGVYGLGLLEAVDESTLVALADENDADGDGISGRVNRVWDVASQSTRLGRFGWKANQPSLRQQIAGAFLGDIGITSSLFPANNCPAPQVDCANAPNGGEPELDDHKLDRVLAYNRLLAVPARRELGDAEALRGDALFHEIGCASCHTSTLETGAVEGFAELSNQTIHPYTDMLLHDMGEELADGRPDFLASGSEWRTPPLWGLGLQKTVNRHEFFLHDGRARGFEEAILWHGGEARATRERFSGLTAQERAAVIRFLQSL